MIRNYIRIAWRSLSKNRVYTIINMAGLATGMAVVMLIGLWIRDELNYNKDFAHYNQVVRVMLTQTRGNEVSTSFSTSIPLGVALRTQYAAGFKKVATTSWNAPHILTVGDNQLSRQGMFVQPDMLDILALQTVDGRKAVLNDPSSILITQSVAIALYGHADATGQSLKFGDSTIFRVAGVIPDMPYNSDFRDVYYFAPWANYVRTHPWVKMAEGTWSENSFQTFAQLEDHVDLDKLRDRVKSAEDGHGQTDKPVVVLHPMSRWHLYNSFWNGKNTGGSIQYVWMFGLIGIFVLLLACINFMNLSTARSDKRAKEVGIRKSVGSMRGHLIGQFLSESILMSLLSFLLALALVAVALPWFNAVSDKQMHISWGNPVFWLPALGLTLLVGLIAGSYPAFYLSSFKPVKVLKGAFRAGRAATLPRQILIVVQFTVSVALIVGTIVVYQQINFVKDRPVGYSREGLITVSLLNNDIPNHYAALHEELLQSGAAVSTCMSSSPTTDVWNNQSGLTWEGKDPTMTPTFSIFWNTIDYGATVGWQVSAGRDFSQRFLSDSLGMILNETAVRYMGLKNPIGAQIRFVHGTANPIYYHVVGVVKDMVMQSPFAPVKQAVYVLDNNNNVNVLTVKINPGLSVSQALPAIGRIIKKYNPSVPFEYTFNDEEYARKFELEDRVGKLAAYFTVLAILVSCLGLFGLSSFMAEQRIKEIGVRKVLGASIVSLWALLSRDFLWLVGLSFFIAIPLAYYVMSGWLLRYAYRVPLSIWVFVVTMGLALLIALLTVSWQALRAARANPVRSLRTE
ncbi:ABC transporter permease [Dinghuibacter silviterrae]|uniref:Putative permease n=1 Tax=Dinghuibacter silviterrae TaxID=1539049 RepID=A0A4R8DH65_9BACT|nr:ABC transporter permease [Dinghuibacter silviterrae]TDW96574.1 putative permease [Dinghuibacter silviterrae]